MRPRDRVMAALDHRETDRVPVDLGGHRSSGISAIAYPRLRAHLDLAPRPVRVYDIQQQLAVLDEDVLDRFGVDTIEMGRAFALDDADWSDWPSRRQPLPGPGVGSSGKDREGLGAAVADGPGYRPDARRRTVLRVGLLPVRSGGGGPRTAGRGHGRMPVEHRRPARTAGGGPGGDERMVEGARRLRQGTDRAIIGLFGGNLMELGQFLYRNDNFLALLAAEPERAHDLLDRLTERHLKNLEKYLGLVGPYIDIILFGDDLGMQTGPQISPRMYREFFKPRHGQMWQRAKELADVKVMLHCCGGVRPLLPDLIEAGLDAINPVQISCKGMDATELKRDFGRDITFWGGGCDTRWLLAHGTPDGHRRTCTPSSGCLEAGGWLRLPTGAQHPGRRAPREHCGHARRGRWPDPSGVTMRKGR